MNEIIFISGYLCFSHVCTFELPLRRIIDSQDCIFSLILIIRYNQLLPKQTKGLNQLYYFFVILYNLYNYFVNEKHFSSLQIDTFSNKNYFSQPFSVLFFSHTSHPEKYSVHKFPVWDLIGVRVFLGTNFLLLQW